MIRTYLLPVERIDGVDVVAGIDYIHDAVLRCTDKPDVRLLVMDTSQPENRKLSSLAISSRNATRSEAQMLTEAAAEFGSMSGESYLDTIESRLRAVEEKIKIIESGHKEVQDGR
jgi:hypothetical protein